MADTEAFYNSWSPFPDYALSSTGSLRLSGLQNGQQPQGDPSCPATVLAFEETHRRRPAPISLRQRLARGCRKEWSKLTVRRLTKRHVPIVKTLRHYNVSRDLLSDLVAGLTVGVMMIPQAMAFALVASLPPVVGLYMALFSSLVYVVLGTSHHLSWNCVAVLAIMMGNMLNGYETHLRNTLAVDPVSPRSDLILNLNLTQPPPSFATAVPASTSEDGASPGLFPNPAAAAATEQNLLRGLVSSSVPSYQEDENGTSSGRGPENVMVTSSSLEKLIAEKKLELACSVSLMSGIILAVLGKLGLGRLASFMSDSLVISFTVGVTFHVLVGQAGNALGLHLPARTGVFKIFSMVADVATHVQHTNWVTAVTFVTCAVIIYVVKRFVNEKYAGKLKVPVPIELIVVIVATAVNTAIKMNETHSVSIVEDISQGIPKPRVPDVTLGLSYLSEGLVIIFVSFTQTVALGKIMALKHSYRVDSNLEMFSLGVGSIVCSFFSGFIPGASITCTVIQDSAGGRTQIASLFASGLVFFVVMFLGPYFYYLPRCVLAAIVVVNVRSMFLKMLAVPALWRKSRADGVVWVCTCLATVVLDTDLGLLVGLAVCVCGVLVRSRLSPVGEVGSVTVDKVQLWRSTRHYHTAPELPRVKVVALRTDFYFVNADLVTDNIVKLSGIDPAKLKRKGLVLHVKEPAGSTIAVNNSSTTTHVVVPDLRRRSSSFTDKAEVKTIIVPCELIQEREVVNIPSEPQALSSHDSLENKSSSFSSSSSSSSSTTTDDNHSLNDHLLPPDVTPQEINQSSGKLDSLKNTTKKKSGEGKLKQPSLSTLVIDFSAVSYMDLMAVEALDILMGDFHAVGVQVMLTSLHQRCVDILRATGFLNKHGDKVFLSTAAALNYT